ncbi:MAG: electron transfer flavoprotein subunit alpha/FixB family protein [Actinomycetaceae bacterium]|nr:electron transfer flavoprotein subunit alpha/FixB family protein [Arcanobacterium sp.]MDD7504383.1 electron transfer flavoprotein subunit alpha/FixB family protein [Actinomycetaceae bacterium]MDY6143047.1 electron transfer flavoprotein subunit alpha/FixB family protein [Arcanobacterium sp.]
MARFLVYSDASPRTAELVTFAQTSGADAEALALSPQQATELESCGATTLLTADIGEATPESCARSIADLVKERGIDVVVIGTTARGLDLAAQVAGFLGWGYGSDVSNLAYADGTLTYERSLYGGTVISEETIEGNAVISVGRGNFAPASGAVGATEAVEVHPDERIRIVAREEIPSEGADITSAEHVVSVGMGTPSKDDIQIAQDLADAMNGAVACSRGVAEERDWLPVESYVGISGKVIQPKLYLALGISGQVQHMYGVRDAKMIVAINTDKNSLICTRGSDYYIVGDMLEYAPLIKAEIEKL